MFNKETEYALRSLIFIQVKNMKGRRPGIIEIAGEIDAPQFFIAKILQRLVKIGILKSQKGKGGGFYFDPDKPDVQLKEIIIASEGDKIYNGCGLGLRHCDENNPCPIHSQYVQIKELINQMITGETIQSIAQKIHDGKDSIINRLK